jgi:uncharacterized protein YacL
MKLYSFTSEALEQQTGVIKNLLLNFMVLKGMITQEVYDNLEKNYAIIVKKPTFFGIIWKKFLNKPDAESYIIVKQQSLSQMEKNEEEEKKDKTLKIVKPKDKDEE